MDTPERTFNTLYDQYADDIFRYLYIRLNSREQALDLTQDVFSRLWVYLSHGKTIEQPRAFLYRSAHNTFVNTIRDNKHTLSLDALSEKGVEFGYTETDRETKERQQEAVARLQAVDERYRTVLTLRYINGLKVKEIAELLDESENNISVRIHRGMEKLKAAYEPD